MLMQIMSRRVVSSHGDLNHNIAEISAEIGGIVSTALYPRGYEYGAAGEVGTGIG